MLPLLAILFVGRKMRQGFICRFHRSLVLGVKYLKESPFVLQEFRDEVHDGSCDRRVGITGNLVNGKQQKNTVNENVTSPNRDAAGKLTCKSRFTKANVLQVCSSNFKALKSRLKKTGIREEDSNKSCFKRNRYNDERNRSISGSQPESSPLPLSCFFLFEGEETTCNIRTKT